jgi:phosphatidylinositol glycan class B
MGLRTSRTHALLVGLVAATWFEMVYFSFRPLTEAVSYDFLLVSLSLSSVPPKELSWQRLVLIGFCIGVSLMLRIQMITGLLFLAVWIGRLEFRERWAPMILGGIPPLLVFGLADWMAWGSPFHSYIAYVQINLIEGKASTFGVDPAFWYFKSIVILWSLATPAILGLIAIRARTSAVWLGVAFCIIATHSLIPHKEYRFIFPATACLVLIAAMGSADLIERVRIRLRPHSARYLVAGGAAFWVAVSTSLAFADGFSFQWFRARDLIKTEYWLAAQPDLCGLLIYDVGVDFDNSAFDSGAYAYLHRDVPLQSRFHEPDEARRSSQEFNYIVLSRSSIADFQPDFGLVRCMHNVCVIKRAGSCF